MSKYGTYPIHDDFEIDVDEVLKMSARLARVEKLVAKWVNEEAPHFESDAANQCWHCVAKSYADELETALKGE